MIKLVDKDKSYVIHYCIKNRQGDILEQTEQDSPLIFYVGDGSVLKKIEETVVDAVANSEKPKKIQLTLLPEHAFGRYEASLKFKVKRRAFVTNEPLTLNQMIYANTPKGKRMVTIIDITENTVVINANHELAGKTLFVDLEILY